ncbi:MAG: hypothetical protein ACREYE_28470 [Gammaproteobacteria bacterium]
MKISIGFFRSVATVAPPRGGKDQELEVEVTNPDGTKTMVHGGDAVSVFSNFDLDYLGNRKDVTPSTTLPLTTEDLNIRTRFASGQAAIEVSENVQVVGAILGVRAFGPDTPDVHTRKIKLMDCVKGIDDKTTLTAIAEKVSATISDDSLDDTKAQINTKIDGLSPLALEGLEQFDEIKNSCPQ